MLGCISWLTVLDVWDHDQFALLLGLWQHIMYDSRKLPILGWGGKARKKMGLRPHYPLKGMSSTTKPLPLTHTS